MEVNETVYFWFYMHARKSLNSSKQFVFKQIEPLKHTKS